MPDTGTNNPLIYLCDIGDVIFLPETIIPMSSKYKVGENAIPHFVTSSVVYWLDALTRPDYKDVIVNSLQYCQENKGLIIHAWVIMSNHVHFIISAKENTSIAANMRDFKKFTSRKLIEAISQNKQESRKSWLLKMFAYAGKNNNSNNDYQFWQQDYHPVELNTIEKTQQRLNYLHKNPVKAGWVWEPQEYKYSSAVDYYTKSSGLIKIEPLI
ncbi:MAG: transposase [Chitinophagaceae bacterium]